MEEEKRIKIMEEKQRIKKNERRKMKTNLKKMKQI